MRAGQKKEALKSPHSLPRELKKDLEQPPLSALMAHWQEESGAGEEKGSRQRKEDTGRKEGKRERREEGRKPEPRCQHRARMKTGVGTVPPVETSDSMLLGSTPSETPPARARPPRVRSGGGWGAPGRPSVYKHVASPGFHASGQRRRLRPRRGRGFTPHDDCLRSARRPSAFRERLTSATENAWAERASDC